MSVKITRSSDKSLGAAPVISCNAVSNLSNAFCDTNNLLCDSRQCFLWRKTMLFVTSTKPCTSHPSLAL